MRELLGPGSKAARVRVRTARHRRTSHVRASLGALLWILAFGSGPAASADERLELLARDSYLPGRALSLRLELRTPDGALDRHVWDAPAEITVLRGDASTVLSRSLILRNGVGGLLVTIGDEGPITIRATVAGASAERTLAPLDASTATTAAGALPAGVTEWSGIVHVTGDLLVPFGSVLRVLPGTIVLLDGVASGSGGIDIDVEGAIESLGTIDRPVTFTAFDAGLPWGELHHQDAAPSRYEHTSIHRAGNSPRGGHTNSGPALRVNNSEVLFDRVTVSDLVGKVMQADDSTLRMFGCYLARAIMGPEIEATELILESSDIHEMRGDDDNDGIYLHDQRAGQELRLTDCVVAGGDDDGIDTLGSHVIVERSISRDWADKSMSVFYGSADLLGCVLANSDIGISAKGSDSQDAVVRLDRCTIVGNRLGVESNNKSNQPLAEIFYTIRSSIIRRPDGVAAARTIRTDYDPSFIDVRWCALSDSWTGAGGEGNLVADPRFVAVGTNDFHLQTDSPCIDAGDPTASLDPDGTRADMGAYPRAIGPDPVARFVRGETNGDGRIDVADAITILLHLFAGGEIGCAKSADADDDGQLTITDPVRVLGWLFTSGAPLPPPSGDTCGPDPTDDTLACTTTQVCS